VKRQFNPGHLLLALLIAWALGYLAEYFDWHLVREAGGGVTAALRTTLYN
jgi:hypothetical protein